MLHARGLVCLIVYRGSLDLGADGNGCFYFTGHEEWGGAGVVVVVEGGGYLCKDQGGVLECSLRLAAGHRR